MQARGGCVNMWHEAIGCRFQVVAKIIGKESLSPKYPTIPHIINSNLFFKFLKDLKN